MVEAAPPSPSGRKRALLIGCSYRGTRHALNGCINDVRCLRHLLKTRFGFRDSDLMVLTDDHLEPQKWPTRANMLKHMRLLVADQRPGDSLFFSFSGHAKRRHRFMIGSVELQPPFCGAAPVPSTSAAALATTDDGVITHNKGMKLTICPCDYKQAGEIVDEELHSILVHPLLAGVKLHCMIDACHSGGALCLDHCAEFVPGAGVCWREGRLTPASLRGTSGGECIQIGAAGDKQTAADTNQLHGSVSTGAATFSLIQAIERHSTEISYAELLESMHESIATLQNSRRDRFFLKLLGRKYHRSLRKQRPSLRSNHQFDLSIQLGI